MIRTAVTHQSLAARNRGINMGIVSQNPRRVYLVHRHHRAQGVVRLTVASRVCYAA